MRVENQSINRVNVEVFAQRPYAIESGSLPECIVKGESRPDLARPVVEFVATKLRDELPSNWDAGYDVFVVDAAKEWPEYAFGNDAVPPFPEGQPVVREKGRPVIAVDVRSQTGMLFVSGPGLPSRFYCVHMLRDGKTRIGLDLFLTLAAD